jgi:YfiH family protein
VRGEIETVRFRAFDALPGVLCAASTRRGGASAPPYESLNMGFSSGDAPDSVRENRRRFFEAVGVPAGEVIVGQQVHGARVQPVGQRDRGRGAIDPSTGIPASDGMVTTDPDVFLFTISADCPLIAIAAPDRRGVALAHSGWRGVAAGMPGAAVEALAGASGVVPREMVAAVCPSIRSCCYPVSEEVVEKLPAAARRAVRRDGGGSPRLDLGRAIRILLEEAGIPPERIEVSPECSCCDPERFFSHRRDGAKTGRIGMVLGIRGD